MKRRTLFTISPHNTDITQLKASLDDSSRSQFEQLVTFIRNKIGKLLDTSTYYYRVTNMIYIKLRFLGINAETEAATDFHLMIVVAGYTEFPSLELAHSARLTMSVADATDAFWLAELLRHELADKAV